MNTVTLSNAQTYIFTKEQYLTAKAQWRLKEHHSAAEHIGYNLIRGFEPTRGFKPLTIPNKITSRSNDRWSGYHGGMSLVQHTLVKGVAKSPSDSERIEQRNKANSLRFKAWFGLELTDELRAAFPKLEYLK